MRGAAVRGGSIAAETDGSNALPATSSAWARALLLRNLIREMLLALGIRAGSASFLVHDPRSPSACQQGRAGCAKGLSFPYQAFLDLSPSSYRGVWLPGGRARDRTRPTEARGGQGPGLLRAGAPLLRGSVGCGDEPPCPAPGCGRGPTAPRAYSNVFVRERGARSELGRASSSLRVPGRMPARGVPWALAGEMSTRIAVPRITLPREWVLPSLERSCVTLACDWKGRGLLGAFL